MSTVGRSSRTPFKHWLLSLELGRLVGIFANPVARAKVHAVAKPFLVVDLCAGDGGGQYGAESSPAIITKHLDFASQRGVWVNSILIEKNAATIDELRANVPRRSWCEIVNSDARDWVCPQLKDRQAVFVHSDPNHIEDWPMTPEFVANLTETTTMLATLGCNVGGLKRLSRDQRMGWYEHVARCVENMPSYHDAVLVRLDGDQANWAYLLRLPTKWCRQTVEYILKSGKKYTEYDLDVASLRGSRESFERIQDMLFQTKKELAK